MTQPKPIKKIQIRAFESSMSMISCISFWEGYSQVLVEESINYNQLSDHNWLLTNSYHGILAEYEGQIIGGLLLFQPTDKNKNFPFKDTTKNTEANSPYELDTCEEKYGEIFALWHSSKAAGWGLSYILLRAGLALAKKLGTNNTLYLTAGYNARLVEKIGFQIVKDKRYEVFFNIKQEPFEVKAYLYHFDISDFSSSKKEKEQINKMAEISSFVAIEKVLGNTLEIEYELN